MRLKAAIPFVLLFAFTKPLLSEEQAATPPPKGKTEIESLELEEVKKEPQVQLPIDKMRLSKNYLFELFDDNGVCRIRLKIPTGYAPKGATFDAQSKRLNHSFNFSAPCFIDQLFLLRAKDQNRDSLPWQAITVYSLKPLGETTPEIKKYNGRSCYQARYARGLALFRVNHLESESYQPYFFAWLDETDDEGHWMCIDLKSLQVIRGGFDYDEMISHVNNLQEAVKQQVPEEVRDRY